MIETVLALFVAIAGFRVVMPNEPAPWTSDRFQLHLCIAVGFTFGIVAIGGAFPMIAPALSGIWLLLLCALYAAHSVGVRNWGSPMSRDILLFGLRGAHRFAASRPWLPVLGLVAMTPVFALGWWVARMDAALFTNRARLELGVAGVVLCVLIGKLVSLRQGRPAATDLLWGVVVGGHGPQAPPPPNDAVLGGSRLPAGSVTTTRRPTVVVAVLDSARTTNMSAYGYDRPTTPFLKSLVERGARAAPLVVSNGASSETGLWAILSSRRVRHQASNGSRLHDVLRAAGYTCHAILSGQHRNFMGLEHLYGSDYHHFEDMLFDEQLVERVNALPVRRDNDAHFFFFHFMSLHPASGEEAPQVWTPSLDRYSREEGGTMSDDERQPFLNHYDNCMRHLDDYLARIADGLAAKGYLDDAIVVVTADHSESVHERTPTICGHGRSLYQESIHIPLIIWDSMQSLPEPALLADQTDIAPTIMELLGSASHANWQGSSIFRDAGGQTVHIEHIYHRMGLPPLHMDAVIALLDTGVYKQIRHRVRGVEVLRQTFHLTTDPQEINDLADSVVPETAAMFDRTFEHYRDGTALLPRTNWKYLGYLS